MPTILRLGLLLLLLWLGAWAQSGETNSDFTGFFEGQPGTYPRLLYLRSAQDWEHFVSQIPTRQITQRQPSPPSNDPLLKACPIDFAHQMAVVGVTDDIYLMPSLRWLPRAGYVLSVKKLDGFGVGAKPDGVGRYRLWVVSQLLPQTAP